MADGWTQLSPVNSPSPRMSQLMALDETRGKVVLWGGYITPTFVSGVWDNAHVYEWDGVNWRTITPALSPPVIDVNGNTIFYFSGCFDGTTGRTMVVGLSPSVFGPYLFHHWSWDGVAWTKILPVHVPIEFSNLRLVYHPGVNKTFMLATEPIPAGTGAGFVWQWDGADWTNLGMLLPIPGGPLFTPNQPDAFICAYDPLLGKLVLTSTGSLFHTYLFDGVAFTELVSASPSTPENRGAGTAGLMAAFSNIVPSRRGIVQYVGNYPGDGHTTRTFQLIAPCGGGSYTWEEISPPPGDPGKRFEPSLCRNVDGSTLLFGGAPTTSPITLANDTWRFEPTACPEPPGGYPVFAVPHPFKAVR